MTAKRLGYGHQSACNLKHVSKSYISPSGGAKVKVLERLDLTILSGTTVGIVGPSGSGKSTLLNIMGCLDFQDKGTVNVAGYEISHLSPARRAEFRNNTIGFVFQLHHLLPQCTVLENILVPTLMQRRSAMDDAHMTRAVDLLQRVGLTDRINHRPAQLSGGECLRAAVARALINRPSILLADEPTGSLDEYTSKAIADLLLEINLTEGVTLVAVTHSNELAGKLGTIYELRAGVLHG